MPDIQAPIQDVTVYRDRALISRSGSIELEAGEHTITITNLPQFVRESLRAQGKGPQGSRILAVDVQTAFHSLPPEPAIQALEAAIEDLNTQLQLNQARQQSLSERQQWIRSVGEQSRDFARSLAQGQMKPQDYAEFVQFMTDQSYNDAEASQKLAREFAQLSKELGARERERDQELKPRRSDRLNATATVSLETRGVFELEISYLVRNASWEPEYDVRVTKDPDKDQGSVEVTYLGIVRQSTGERWENARLSLSTARPSLASILPELKPWYLSVWQAPPPTPKRNRSTMVPLSAPMMQAQQAGSTDAFYGAAADFDKASEREAPPPTIEAEIRTATTERSGASFVFRISQSVDIPSNNTPYKTTIARDNLEAGFDYVSAPVLDEHVHLRSTITNSTHHTYLPGKANIFFEGDFVGTTQITETAATENFKVFLGLDDQIKIKHELSEQNVEKGNLLQGDLRRITYAYRMKINNYAKTTRTVEIQDRLPVSQHERVKVKVLQIQPATAVRTKLEILTWRLPIAPNEETQIEYRIQIEHPQNLDVHGLPVV